MGRTQVKVLFLTEGGKNIGFGHMTRCISLSQAFTEKGIVSEFIVNGDNSIVDLLKGKNYRIFNWLKEKDRLFKTIAGIDIGVIDSYLADTLFYKDISALVKIPVYMDDNIRVDYPKGIVVNGSIYAEKMHYPKKEGTSYLLGVQYFPLRKEFWVVPEKVIKENIETLMITFGGDDIRCMTKRILRFLREHYPALKKRVIVGKGFKNIKEIELLKDKRTELIYFPNANQMKNVMLASDIAISMGGQTLYELARVGLATITIAVADNQLNNIKGWGKAGFIEYAGWWKDKLILKKINYCIRKLNNVNERIKKYQIGKGFIDAKGSRAIVEFTINKLFSIK